MGRYAFVVPANMKYMDCLNVFLNSLERTGNLCDVHLISWGLPQLNKRPFNIIQYEISDNPKMQELGEGECLMRYRYKLASELDYDAVCVMDADSLIVRDLGIWFEISARADVIIGCGLEQKRWYPYDENHKVNGEHVLTGQTWNDKDICCSPLFFNPKRFGDAFRYAWSIVADYPREMRFKAPDMDAINMAIIKYGYSSRVIALAEAAWSGLHETLLKPLSHVCEMHGNLWTINGEEIWLIHGQYLNETWRGWQIGGQLGCVDREFDGSPRCKQIAISCLEYLHAYYRAMNEWKSSY